MQISHAHNVADEFVSFIGDPRTAIEDELGDEYVQQLPQEHVWLDYVSDWLHLWMLSGLGYRSCVGDSVTYIGAVALVYAELATNPALFEGHHAVPAMPEALLTQTLDENAKFVSSPEFWLPVALTPAVVELSRMPNKEAQRTAVATFVEHPEWHRYGFNTYRYFPPNPAK